MKNGLAFGFWKTDPATLPPVEGTDYTWTFAPVKPSIQSVKITNPNDKPMTIAWVAFPSPTFSGPTANTVIPPHSSRDIDAGCTGAAGTDTTTGSWTTADSTGALTGNADSS